MTILGLGKTLSMIALIIAQKEIREQKSSDSDENDESSSNDWKQKGRKDCKYFDLVIIYFVMT